MDEKIRKFFADKNLHIHKLIIKAPPGLNEEQIEKAAHDVYGSIQNGEEISDYSIARTVWERAKKINGEQYERKEAFIKDARAIIDGYKQKMDTYKTRLKYSIILSALSIGINIWLLITSL